METKVSPALVGAFVLLLGVLLIGTVMWLAAGGVFRPEHDRYVAIEEESVAGLNLNAPVKYHGVDVGKVTAITLDPANLERVRLSFALDRGTPIKADTVAVLKIQGLTGIAYVELSGGSPGSPLLVPSAEPPYPTIRTKPSLSTRLENVLTAVLAKLDRTSGNIDAVLSDANRAAVTQALADVAVVARTIAARQATIDAAITSAARSLDATARASAKLGPALDDIARSARAVETMGDELAATGGKAGQVVETAGADLQHFTAQTLPELQRVLGELGVLSASLRRLSEQTERSPSSLVWGRQPLPLGPGETVPPGRVP